MPVYELRLRCTKKNGWGAHEGKRLLEILLPGRFQIYHYPYPQLFFKEGRASSQHPTEEIFVQSGVE